MAKIQIEPLTIFDRNYRDLLTAGVDPIIAQQIAASSQRSQQFYRNSSKQDLKARAKDREEEEIDQKYLSAYGIPAWADSSPEEYQVFHMIPKMRPTKAKR